MGLRLQVGTIGAEGFDLELVNAGAPSDVIGIARAVALQGHYEHDERAVRVKQVSASELDLSRVAWRWAGGRLELGAEAELRQVAIDLTIARGAKPGKRPLTGAIATAHAHLRALTFESGSLKLTGEAALAGLEVQEPAGSAHGSVVLAALRVAQGKVAAGETSIEVDGLEATSARVLHGDGSVEVSATEMRVSALTTSVGGARIAIDHIAARSLSLHRREGALELVLGHCELRGVDLQIGGSSFRLERVELPAGLSFRGGALAVESLAVDAIRIDADLAGGNADAAPPSKKAKKTNKTKLDLALLDGLEGRVDVDVTVDARVPFLKHRVATHKFRVPVKGGTIDYHELERDLSLLEDSLIDFEVRKGRLVLEVKPPILRFAKKTLVEWPLQPDELELAERRRVRLRTLLEPRLPKRKDEAEVDDKESSFELRKLDFDPIDAELRLQGPFRLALDMGTVLLGDQGIPAVAELRVTGALHHRAKGTPPPGEVHLTARGLRLGLDALHAGSARIDAGVIEVASAADVVVRARGLAPTGVSANLEQVSIRALRVEIDPPRRSKR